ncbi:hypothetical protein BDV97DRAFT_399362 [Delphinella strobiligena]|nr:hypothetical protein BDV97DRAFT_399362 [Delphinella strobiligena]
MASPNHHTLLRPVFDEGEDTFLIAHGYAKQENGRRRVPSIYLTHPAPTSPPGAEAELLEVPEDIISRDTLLWLGFTAWRASELWDGFCRDMETGVMNSNQAFAILVARSVGKRREGESEENYLHRIGMEREAWGSGGGGSSSFRSFPGADEDSTMFDAEEQYEKGTVRQRLAEFLSMRYCLLECAGKYLRMHMGAVGERKKTVPTPEPEPESERMPFLAPATRRAWIRTNQGGRLGMFP